MGLQAYFFLCLFFLKRFLRLWVAILCLFLFFPLGIALSFYGRLFNLFLHFVYESLGRLERGNIVGGDDDGGVFRNVAPGFFSSLFDYKASESPEVNILSVYH